MKTMSKIYGSIIILLMIFAFTLGACEQEAKPQQVVVPVANPPSGTYSSTQFVTLTSMTEGAVIYYTTDGSVPTTASSLYSGTIAISVNTTLKAIAVKSGSISDVMTAEYTIIVPVVVPVANPPSGTYSGTQLVMLTCATEGAIIYYTTDGSVPTTASSLYAGSIAISIDTTLKAIAMKSGMSVSEVLTAEYTITAPELVPLTEVKWLEILQSVQADNTFDGTLDLSGYTRSSSATGSGLRSDGTFDPGSNILVGKGKIVSLILPDTTTAIVDGTSDSPTFRYFTNLENFNGALITSIGNYAFTGCTKLSMTALPEWLTSIGEGAFKDCTSLTSIMLPAEAASIGLDAFRGCTNLTVVTSPRVTPPTLGLNAFTGTSLSLEIRVPPESVTSYRATNSGWYNYRTSIIAIGPAPVITINTQPDATRDVVQGNSASLSVAATVTQSSTLSYQWYSNTENNNIGGTAISGATNTTYSSPTNTAGTYYYFCVVRAVGAASVRSSVATVNVITPIITINTQPAATLDFARGSITGSLSITATATPSATLSYQWYSNTSNSNTGGTTIYGATSASYTIPTSLAGGTYYYFCEVTRVGAISVRSSVATVNVHNITIETQPATTTTFMQGNITGSLSVAATITPSATLSYQWYSNTENSNTNGTAISGATNASYTIPTNLTGGIYYYFCEIMATGATTIRSSVARVNVYAITINTQPDATRDLVQGSISGSLSVTATVTPNATLSYQWYSNTSNNNTDGTAISGATSANYTIPTNLTGGTYYYFCEVRVTGITTVRSSVAMVNVTTTVITIDTQPTTTLDFIQGSITGSLSVTATVTSSATLSYQWYSNTSNSNTGGTAISGATNANYTIPTNLAAGTRYYFCEVRAGAISVRSSVATVNVYAITISTQPTATTNLPQGNITGNLSVTATVTPSTTLSYQWYSNTENSNTDGTAISGATSRTYTIPTNLTAGTYYYFCEISAGTVSVRSSVARVNVHAITINTQPVEMLDFVYGNITGSLSVTATVTSSATLSYQWYRNTSNSNTGGTTISGATSANYTIPTNLTAGTYYYFCEVRATGAVSVRSSVATVNVYAITINTQPTATNLPQGGNITSNLSVTATVTPNTTLSYQWYSNTSNSNTGGTAISGATNASYTIPTNLTGGTYYYFCEVSAGTASVRSNAANVNVFSSVVFEMVLIPSGSFQRGSSTVTLTGFYMSKYQVTQEQYQSVMGVNPSYFNGESGREPASGEVQGRRPVEVSWYDAIVFCNWLSIAEGLTPAYSINGSTNPNTWGTVPTSWNTTWNAVTIVAGSTGYRLPTEAQWEHACRAGTTTDYYWGDQTDTATVGQYAWYSSNSNSRTHEVGKKLPNNFGLYDMSGNVWEWCWDWYASYPSGNQTDPVGASSGSYRVNRGGSWSHFSGVENLQSADRGSYFPDSRLTDFGFRVLRP